MLCPSERHFINTGPEVIKPLFMLNSFDHEICRYKRMRQSSSEKKNSCSYKLSNERNRLSNNSNKSSTLNVANLRKPICDIVFCAMAF